uniref:Uncharacterized protein n=1 Tax=Cacopsylla melanoneura TaxID=428564 RepID=A0A8D9F7X0_9HEMI
MGWLWFKTVSNFRDMIEIIILAVFNTIANFIHTIEIDMMTWFKIINKPVCFNMAPEFVSYLVIFIVLNIDFDFRSFIPSGKINVRNALIGIPPCVLFLLLFGFFFFYFFKFRSVFFFC